MTIKWDDRFSVGHIAVDAEHKLLLTLINALELALRHPEDKTQLLFFIDQLKDFALLHFKHEEMMQLKHQFPFQEDNANSHRILENDLVRIHQDIHRIAKKPLLSAEDMSDLHGYVSYLAKDWLLNHVLKEDIKMKGFMGDGL